MKYGFILGSHPGLSFAELQVVLPDVRWEDVQQTVAWAEGDLQDVEELQTRLGGTIKMVEPIMHVGGKPSPSAILEHLQPAESGKFVFGFSLYHKANKRLWDRLGIDMKKALRAQGFSVRYITTKEPILSTIVVKKEGLLKNGADLCLLPSKSGTVLARTVACQDPRELAKRDYGKKRRPTRVGMLPVKLAKIMINLANQPMDARVLDPFMGSGTVLTELLLMGYDPKDIHGSDLTKRGVDHTEENLRDADLPIPNLNQIDARKLSEFHAPGSIDAIVSEGHLGLPKTDADRNRSQKEMEVLYREVLGAYAAIMKPGGTVVMAFPAYVMDSGTVMSLSVQDAIKKHGFAPHRFSVPAPFDVQTDRGSLLYGRPQQRVKREIFVLHYRPGVH